MGTVYLIWANLRLNKQVKQMQNSGYALNKFQKSYLDQLQKVSHDFRGPLAAVMGYVDLMIEDRIKTPSDRQRCLSNARSSLNKMHEIICQDIDEPLKELMTVMSGKGS